MEGIFQSASKRSCHIASKKYTLSIEQNNSNTRHYLARMVRKSKVVSESEDMLNSSLKCYI
ncbi:MAG: IS1 family transposase [Alphaproteobacteria bacterium]|nr:IS1 family transposase [Alphaproteobacteria bacterium]